MTETVKIKNVPLSAIKDIFHGLSTAADRLVADLGPEHTVTMIDVAHLLLYLASNHPEHEVATYLYGEICRKLYGVK